MDYYYYYYYYYEHISSRIDDGPLVQYRALLCFFSEQADFLHILSICITLLQCFHSPIMKSFNSANIDNDTINNCRWYFDFQLRAYYLLV